MQNNVGWKEKGLIRKWQLCWESGEEYEDVRENLRSVGFGKNPKGDRSFLYLPIFLHFNTKVFFVFKKVQEKKKEQEAAKPDPDADYVDDDEDYGYDPEFEDDDADSSVDEDDNEPV